MQSPRQPLPQCLNCKKAEQAVLKLLSKYSCAQTQSFTRNIETILHYAEKIASTDLQDQFERLELESLRLQSENESLDTLLQQFCKILEIQSDFGFSDFTELLRILVAETENSQTETTAKSLNLLKLQEQVIVLSKFGLQNFQEERAYNQILIVEGETIAEETQQLCKQIQEVERQLSELQTAHQGQMNVVAEELLDMESMPNDFSFNSYNSVLEQFADDTIQKFDQQFTDLLGKCMGAELDVVKIQKRIERKQIKILPFSPRTQASVSLKQTRFLHQKMNCQPQKLPQTEPKIESNVVQMAVQDKDQEIVVLQGPDTDEQAQLQIACSPKQIVKEQSKHDQQKDQDYQILEIPDVVKNEQQVEDYNHEDPKESQPDIGLIDSQPRIVSDVIQMEQQVGDANNQMSNQDVSSGQNITQQEDTVQMVEQDNGQIIAVQKSLDEEMRSQNLEQDQNSEKQIQDFKISDDNYETEKQKPEDRKEAETNLNFTHDYDFAEARQNNTDDNDFYQIEDHAETSFQIADETAEPHLIHIGLSEINTSVSIPMEYFEGDFEQPEEPHTYICEEEDEGEKICGKPQSCPLRQCYKQE